jgi:ERCC4-type nuclease
MIRKTRKTSCPITKSKRKRAAANKQTAAIQNNFPSGIAQPALRALANAGYTSLEQLTKVKETDLQKLHGMGPKAISNLRAALKAKGHSFQS